MLPQRSKFGLLPLLQVGLEPREPAGGIVLQNGFMFLS